MALLQMTKEGAIIEEDILNAHAAHPYMPAQ